ncbi:TonB-dependent receptor plug domain-containing protein [Methylovulum psychrotolerans]|uniref:TonB-dependent receptor plug domain-containing protein n=1 Tax=Methylovulum psychrotolerans TaxID=1704499 RepID=UPI001E2D9ED2|nr:TonB-dependent receptor [Methylovulum psychrotolerans]
MNLLLPHKLMDFSGLIGRRQRLRNAIGLCLALGTPQLAQAGGSDAELESELQFLAAERHIVVTASKLQESVDKTVATTSVITQDDIQHIGARNLLDVLRLVPGLGVTQTMLGVREIEVRGVKTLFSDKVLFMLNGHPLDHNLQNAGSTWVYDDLPVDTIKRVEVVRGPGSALYGANAFMAVINIITQNAKDLNGLHASVGAGSFGAQQYRASWGKQYDNTAEAALHFNHTDTDGIGSPVPQDSMSIQGLESLAPGKSQLNEGRNDMEWQLGYQGFKLDGRYISKRTGTFVGAAFALSNRTVQNYEDYFIRLSRNWRLSESFTVDTQVYHDSFSFDNLLQLAPHSFGHVGLQNMRNGGEVQGNYQLSANQTIISGVSYNEDEQSDVTAENGSDPSQLEPTLPYGKSRKRTRWGVYAQDVWDLWPNLRMTLGARYDRYNDFGGTFNPRLGFNWEFIKDYSLKFSYGTAYRAPAFGELDLINNPILSGNPNLSPEQAETFESGIVTHPVQGLTAQATYYHTHISELISQVPAQTTFVQYANSGSMLSEGVELENRYDFSGSLQGSFIAANIVYQHTIQNNLAVADVPKARANLLLNWAFNSHWSLYGHVLIKDATGRGVGDSRPDVPGYAVLDMSMLGQHFFSKRLDVSFTVYNLLDKTYFDPAPTSVPGDYQQAGRAFFGHVNVRY